MSAIIPGLGLMNYILGWFTVPAEVFLRRNFGERYFTRANFIAGLILLLVFHFASSIIGAFMSFIPFSGQSGGQTSPWMWNIIKWYFFIGIFHFLRIWWNNIMDHPVHGQSAGESWLRPIGKLVMRVCNLFLNPIVRLLVQILPGYESKQLEEALPVLRDTDTFTERFIEPLFLLILAFIASASGQTAVFLWLLVSVIALNLYTGLRHQAERAYILDIRDQLIEARQIREAINGVNSGVGGQASRMNRFIRETAKEVEKTPEMMETIRMQHPGLADAIAAVNARKRKANQKFNDFEAVA